MPLSTESLCSLWETCAGSTAAGRAAWFLEMAGQDPARVTPGGQDSALAAVYAMLFGGPAVLTCECSSCSVSIEVEVAPRKIAADAGATPDELPIIELTEAGK